METKINSLTTPSFSKNLSFGPSLIASIKTSNIINKTAEDSGLANTITLLLSDDDWIGGKYRQYKVARFTVSSFHFEAESV